MKTEHWTGEMPCNINGFRKTESLIGINNAMNTFHHETYNPLKSKFHGDQGGTGRCFVDKRSLKMAVRIVVYGFHVQGASVRNLF